MVIGNLDLVGITVAPLKANAPLIINAYAVLTLATTFEFLQPIPGWQSQVRQILGCIEHNQLSECPAMNIVWKLSRTFSMK